MSKQYTTGDYLGGYICPSCGAVDSLYYDDCPSCLDMFICCGKCSYKSSSEDCEALAVCESCGKAECSCK